MKKLFTSIPLSLSFLIIFSCSNEQSKLTGSSRRGDNPKVLVEKGKIESGAGDVKATASTDSPSKETSQNKPILASTPDLNKLDESESTPQPQVEQKASLPDVNFFYGYFTYTNKLSELEGHSNVVLGPSSISFIEEAIARKIKPIVWLSTSVLLFDIINGRSYLKSNYLEIWNEYANYMRPYIDNIYGFYPIDEPFWAGKASAEDQNKLNLAIKASFPGKPIMTTFAVPTLSDGFRVPYTYDYVSVDHYGSSFDTDKAYYYKLKSMLSQNQKIFLLGDGFHPSTTPITQQGLNLRTTKAKLAYDFARNSGEPIVGILNYVWDSFTTDWPATTGKSYTGIRDMQGTKDTFINVGRTAVANQ